MSERKEHRQWDAIKDLPISVAVFDTRMCFVAYSNHWKASYGIPQELSLIGKSHYEVFPEIPERWRAIHQRALAGEHISAKADRFVRHDGSVRYDDWDVKPWQGEDGTIMGIVITTRDVTSDVEVERVVSKLRVLFDEALEAILVLDFATGKFVDANPFATKMYGYTKEEFLHLGANDLDVVYDAAEVRRVQENIVIRGWDKFTTQHVTQSGAMIDVRVYAVKVELDGKPHMYISVQDITEEKKTEEQLQELAELLEQSQKIAKLGVWTYDMTDNSLTWSDETYAIFEVDRKSFVPSYESFFSMIHPDDRQNVANAYAQALKTREKYHIVHRLLLPDGKVKWVEERSDTFYSQDGKALRSIGTVYDITLQKEQEESIRLQKQEFETIFNTSKDAIAITDLETNFLKFNDKYTEITGYSQEELYEKSCIGLSVPEDVPAVQSMLLRALNRGFFENFEKTCIRKDGTLVTVNMSIVLMPDRQRFLITAKDITEKYNLRKNLEQMNATLEKRVEEELKERVKSIKLFRDVIDSSSNTVVLLDRDYTFRIVNQTFKQLHQKTDEEVIGKRPDEAGVMIGAFFETKIKPALDKVLAGETLNFKTWLERGDKKLYLVVQMTPFRPNDVVEGVIIVTTDITKTYYLEQENFNNQKKAAMGELIGIIAHQLKQPLNTISLTASLISLDYEDGELDKERIDKYEDGLTKSVQFMAKSIDELRNFFRPDKQPEPFFVRETIAKALAIVSTNISGKGIDIRTDYGPDCSINGFENELQQVVLNIVTNAKDILVEKKPPKPFIQIRTFMEKGSAVIEIDDNGGGIREEDMEKIFESYYTTKGQAGTGIGLNLSKMIVQNSLGGKLSVRNSTEGAVFRIELNPMNPPA